MSRSSVMNDFKAEQCFCKCDLSDLCLVGTAVSDGTSEGMLDGPTTC